MKKLIPLIFLFGCSHKETPRKYEHKISVDQDTLIASFHNEIKSIKSTIELNDKFSKRAKDSLNKQIKKLHHKNKNLQYENEFYLDAIDGYADVILEKDTIR